MLDLAPCHRSLDSFHQKFIDETLDDDLTEAAFEAFDPSRYTPDELSYGCAAWQMRTLDEYRSQLAFTQLTAELGRLGVAMDAIGTGVRVVRDEARHVELCRRLVKALGGSDSIEGEPVHAMADERMPPIYRVLHHIVGSLCVGETFSVRVLTAVRDRTRDELTKAVMTRLVADESIHSRYGWCLLELVTPHLDEGARDWVKGVLPRYLRMAERAVVPIWDPSESGDDEEDLLFRGPDNPFGTLPPQDRRRLFEETIEKDIIKPLDELGWAGQAAWEQARSA